MSLVGSGGAGLSFVGKANRRVVVTGLGVISPIGNSVEEFQQALLAGRSGITASESSDRTRTCVGAVKNFSGKIEEFGPMEPSLKRTLKKTLKLMNRETQLAVAATQQAIAASGLRDVGYEPERVGVCFGAGNVSMLPQDFAAGVRVCTNEADEFEFDRWGSAGLEQVAPLWILRCLPNMPACHIAIINDLRGPNNSITQREAAANMAVTEAYNAIASGDVDAMVTGGTGTTIQPFNKMQAEIEDDVAHDQRDPETLCRPFDRNRSGAVLAEAAASLILEDYEVAIDRGATIYGEIVGTGSSAVSGRSGDFRRRAAAANAMRAALRKAKLSPDGVGHVHAHGLGSRRGDIDEACAIRDVFDRHASQLPLMAIKSNTGNAGAGSGAIELVASLLALKSGKLFPVLNYEEPDPQCPVAPVRSSDREAGDSFLNLNIVAQGQASCLAVCEVAT